MKSIEFSNLSKGSAQEASITFISPPQTKNPDDSLTFDCTVTKPKDINVSWLKDNTMLTLGNFAVFQNPRIRISVDESSNTYSLHVGLNYSSKQTRKIIENLSLSLRSKTSQQRIPVNTNARLILILERLSQRKLICKLLVRQSSWM